VVRGAVSKIAGNAASRVSEAVLFAERQGRGEKGVNDMPAADQISNTTLTKTAGLERTGKGKDWRASKWLVIVELLIVVLIFLADFRHLIFFSKTPYLVLFGWLSLRLRRLQWGDVGLSVFRKWNSTIGMGIAAGLLLEGFQLFVSQPILVKVLGKQPDLEDFRPLIGNLKLTLIFLALTWTLAAFGEEMVYRGYLMNRVADLFNRTRGAWIISLIGVHVAFGIAHAYQGWTGIIDEGLSGLLLGVIYLGTGRNLGVPIIAHGIGDTIDFVLIFLGKYPGM
jgi:membrane protease YdiL (CAAX protease family)